MGFTVSDFLESSVEDSETLAHAPWEAIRRQKGKVASYCHVSASLFEVVFQQYIFTEIGPDFATILDLRAMYKLYIYMLIFTSTLGSLMILFCD